MISVEGDDQQTSTKLRKTAAYAVQQTGRPMTSHEIQEWINLNDPILEQEIRGKCSDYVRIILSLTKGKVFDKYKCKTRMKNIDKRAIFYGLTGNDYPTTGWARIGHPEKRIHHDQRPIQVQHHRMELKDIYIPPIIVEEKIQSPIISLISFVDEEMAQISWEKLRNSLPKNDLCWGEILQAIRDIIYYVEHNLDISNIVPQLIDKYPRLSELPDKRDVAIILSREVFVRQTLAQKEPIAL